MINPATKNTNHPNFFAILSNLDVVPKYRAGLFLIRFNGITMKICLNPNNMIPKITPSNHIGGTPNTTNGKNTNPK